jgi:hypothetical protein
MSAEGCVCGADVESAEVGPLDVKPSHRGLVCALGEAVWCGFGGVDLVAEGFEARAAGSERHDVVVDNDGRYGAFSSDRWTGGAVKVKQGPPPGFR